MRAYDRFFVDNGYLEKVQGWGSGIHYRATKKGQDNPVITNKLSNTMLIRSAEYFERNFTQKAKKGTVLCFQRAENTERLCDPLQRRETYLF